MRGGRKPGQPDSKGQDRTRRRKEDGAMPRLRKVVGGNGQRNDPLAQERPEALTPFGLGPGDTIRFRRKDGARWTEGKVWGVNKDGSLHLTDGRGSARAIPASMCEKKTMGPRRGVLWVPVEEP